MKCNDSRRKSKHHDVCAHAYALRRGKCSEKGLFDNKMKHMVGQVNTRKKTRNHLHLPSIDVTRRTFNNNNNTITCNTSNALPIYQPVMCKDNCGVGMLYQNQHQYSDSLSSRFSMGKDKDHYNLDYSLHNTYSQFLLAYSHKAKSTNKHHQHHQQQQHKQETFEYFTFVPSSKHMKRKQRIKSDIVSMECNVNDNNKDREGGCKHKDKKECYVNKEEFWTVKGAKKPYYIANAIREECIRKLRRRKLDDIEIKPTNTSTDYNDDTYTYDHLCTTNNNYYVQ